MRRLKHREVKYLPRVTQPLRSSPGNWTPAERYMCLITIASHGDRNYILGSQTKRKGSNECTVQFEAVISTMQKYSRSWGVF